MNQKIQKFWDKQAKRYDSSEKQFADVYKNIITKTATYLDSTDNVLDFGCATGNKTIELAPRVGRIHGLDISLEMINEANRKKVKLNLSHVSFSQGTIYSADLKEASFDKIIAYGIIHLLEDKEKAIERIYELLKPGGLFISTTACMKEKMNFKTRLSVISFLCMKNLGMLPLHLNMFTATDVEKLMRNHNFEIIESEKITTGIPAIFIIARK